MSILALVLVLIAAAAHSTWNLLAKIAGGGALFVWLFSSLAMIIYAPLAVAVFVMQNAKVGAMELISIAGSSVIHIFYYLSLQRGYRLGDFSVVYPTARSTGTLLATSFAIFLFDETPTLLAILGAILIITGVFLLTGDVKRITSTESRQGVLWGILTGVFISSYTLCDKYAVTALHIPPLFFDWGTHLGRSLLLTPYGSHHWTQALEQWRNNWPYILGVAVLSPLAYILVLTALVFTPVSYVAPAREISIVIGAFLGVRVLAEGKTQQRLFVAVIMAAGMVALALG